MNFQLEIKSYIKRSKRQRRINKELASDRLQTPKVRKGR